MKLYRIAASTEVIKDIDSVIVEAGHKGRVLVEVVPNYKMKLYAIDPDLVEPRWTELGLARLLSDGVLIPDV
jgi:hypothetical protein